MAAYAALAVGLINLRYQTGDDSNLAKSLVLVIPSLILLALTFIESGKKFLQSKVAVATTFTIGSLLLIYSFVV